MTRSTRLAALILFALGSVGCAREEPLPQLYPVPDTAMVNQEGQAVQLEELKGNVTVYNFIFTNCAGICPLMTQKMRSLVTSVEADQPVRFVSISVDPERDTVEALRAYAKRAGEDPRWIYLRADSETVIDLSQEGFKLAAGTSIEPGTEEILHSPRFVLVDRQGMIRGYYDSNSSEDLDRLRRHIAILVKEK